MTAQLQRRALELMDEALMRPVAGRKAWLDQVCGADAELKAAVGRLMAADVMASSILPTEPPEPIEFAELDPPDRVGPYRLDRLLGRGGMGEVYLGVRDDGLFDQQVAVKLLRPSIFPGASARYFETERRLLATLRHPGIARILDGGVEPGGRPYFIMERVQGEAIDVYAQGHQLGVREIGALVARLCRAVQAAHQALVVHADIKPSNVMVEPDGEPRLLDFGIACLAGGEAEGDTRTAFPATPAFASPQRLEGDRPTTADDVYALGALLRALVTGEVETAPKGPASAAIGEALELTALERRRRARQTAGDLDAIIAKAMRPDPAGRYATAQALADDLDRWARHEPVSARSGEPFYAAAKLLRRRPWASATAAAGLAALILGASVITALYVEARQARTAAETRFTDARTMANYLLFDVYDRLERSPQTLATRQDIARVGERFLVSLSTDTSAPLQVRLDAIRGLIRLAELQGGAGRSLGQPAEARADLDRAAALQAALARTAPRRADVATAGADIAIARATLTMFVDMHPAEAEGLLARGRAEIDRALRLAPDDPQALSARMRWLVTFSLLRQWQARYAESIEAARQGLVQWGALPERLRNADANRAMAARAYDALAESTFYQGAPAAAVAPYQASLALRQGLLSEQPRDPQRRLDLARAQWQIGSTFVDLDRNAEALPILQAGLANAREVAAFDAADAGAQRQVRILAIATAQALAGLRRFDEAIPMLLGSVEERRRLMIVSGGRPQAVRDYSVAIASLGDVYAQAGRHAEACESFRQASAVFEDMRRSGALTRFDADYPMQSLARSLAQNHCEPG